MAERRPTIYDVARRCGVAASTVSRAFGNPSRVSATTRNLVRAAAAEIGYEPRPLARAEAPGRSRTLMLVVTDIANPYYAGLIKAAQSRAIERHYALALTDSDESPQVEAGNLRHLLANSTGGILATSRLADDSVRQLARHRPLVMVNRVIEGLPSLVVDTAAGMRTAVRHLAAFGHRRIAYLSGPRNSWINGQRWGAVHAEAASLGLRSSFLGPHSPTREGGRDAAEAFVLDGATAAIAYNDLVAIGAMQRLQVMGLRLPEDRSVVGCDDIFGADLVVPGLTTIAGPAEQVGGCAVDAVHAELTGGGTRSRTFDAHLVVRGSTGPATDGN
ncbi:LacI family DNA-binding transcriptional regulator [Saccharopolyspora sp. 7B]|uniref:LacI family DNA-binding transcriptional regulator n=1 Tax=Saccharopolyspora sp. 7B TaxID=2877240 RepID=UPI001CD68F2A|nr:LacI family DNA-binding transcriptional regulator [Saccharopolyspora sp. 7B]MCA1278910.1 LacI family transcriptional regulator [Saccharopolyspora sp. 7B]